MLFSVMQLIFKIWATGAVAQNGNDHLETNLVENHIVEQMKIIKFLIELLISN